MSRGLWQRLSAPSALKGLRQAAGEALSAASRPLCTDPVLRRYLWFILLGHVFCVLFLTSELRPSWLLRSYEPTCWPFFPSCWQYRFEQLWQVYAMYGGYLAVVAATAWCRYRGRAAAAYFGLAALNILLFAIICLDYRLRQNQFYMFLWLNLILLVGPARRATLPLLIVSFYFWAGRLKLNQEWLSGSVLYGKLWLIPPELVVPACYYVVVLEMVFIWGLIANNRRAFSFTFGQLILFHLQSLSQIGWFYPAIMACILAYLPLAWGYGERQLQPGVRGFFTGRWPPASYGTAAVFGLCQLAPLLYRGDPALLGQGRLFALHMFEARQSCEVGATLHFVGRDTHLQLKTKLPNRVICDPVIYFSRAKNLCRRHRADPDFIDLDLYMGAKRNTDAEMQQIIAQPDFCRDEIAYHLFSNNSWFIYPGPEPL